MILAPPDLAWAALRAVGLVLLMQVAGAAQFITLFGVRLTHSATVIRDSALRTATLALAVLAAQWCVEPAHLAGEWAGLADAALWRLALSSSAALVLALRLAGVAAVSVGLRMSRPAARAVSLAGGVLVVGSFALTGHTTVSPARWLAAPLLLMHVAIVAFWLGSLLPLRQVCAREPHAGASAVVGAFSVIALRLVPLIPLAGAGLAALLLPDLRALLAPYGLLLLGKLTLFASLLALAARNRLRLAPALARGAPGAAAALRRAITAECLLICLVLVVTSVLTGFFSPSAA